MEKKKKLLENDRTSNILIIIGAILFAFALVSFLWHELNLDFTKEINAEKFGQFGDFIGGIVGSIWALAGVVLFYIALVEQRKDIKINSETFQLQLQALNQQVEEYRFQRTELESSRKVYEQQSKTLKLQQFDSNFFSLINLYLSIKHDLSSLVDNKDFFKTIFEKLYNKCPYNTDIEIFHLNQMNLYEEIFNKESGKLSHYFRSFYRIIKIIDSSNLLDESEKFHYSKIIRAQLSDFEQIVLFYNSFSERGSKTKELILRYDLFKNIQYQLIPNFKSFMDIHGNFNLSHFIEEVIHFVSININNQFDIGSSIESVSDKISFFNCIINMEFDIDQTFIELHCNKDLHENNFNLTEDQLLKLFETIIVHMFIYKHYIDASKFKIFKSKEITDEKIVFKLKIVFEENSIFNFSVGGKNEG